nr:unnamed protein product [Digitaria exilis]
MFLGNRRIDVSAYRVPAYNSVLTLSALATLYPLCESNPVKKPDSLELNPAD